MYVAAIVSACATIESKKIENNTPGRPKWPESALCIWRTLRSHLYRCSRVNVAAMGSMNQPRQSSTKPTMPPTNIKCTTIKKMVGTLPGSRNNAKTLPDPTTTSNPIPRSISTESVASAGRPVWLAVSTARTASPPTEVGNTVLKNAPTKYVPSRCQNETSMRLWRTSKLQRSALTTVESITSP